MDPTTHNDHQASTHQSRPKNQRLIMLGVGALLIGMVALAARIYIQQAKQSSEGTLSSTDQTIDRAAAVDEAQNTLLIELTITGNADKLFALAGITEYNGYSPDAKTNETQYTLALVGVSGVLHTASFAVPVVIAETLSADGSLARVATYPQKSVVVKTPFAPEGTKIVVRNKVGKVVYEDSVRGIIKQESSADYETVVGDDIK